MKGAVAVTKTTECVQKETVTREIAGSTGESGLSGFRRERTYNISARKKEKGQRGVEGRYGEKRETKISFLVVEKRGWGQGGSRIESLCLLGGDHRPWCGNGCHRLVKGNRPDDSTYTDGQSSRDAYYTLHSSFPRPYSSSSPSLSASSYSLFLIQFSSRFSSLHRS